VIDVLLGMLGFVGATTGVALLVMLWQDYWDARGRRRMKDKEKRP